MSLGPGLATTRNRSTTAMDEQAKVHPGRRDKRDLLRRNFSAAAPNPKRCGDITEIPTPVRASFTWPRSRYLDLCGPRLLACPMSDYPDASWRTFRGGLAVLCRATYRCRCGGTS